MSNSLNNIGDLNSVGDRSIVSFAITKKGKYYLVGRIVVESDPFSQISTDSRGAFYLPFDKLLMSYSENFRSKGVSIFVQYKGRVFFRDIYSYFGIYEYLGYHMPEMY